MPGMYAADRQGLFRLSCFIGGAVCGLAAAVTLVLWGMRSSPSCEAVYRQGEFARATALCLESYERSKKLPDLVRAARAYTHLSEWKEAERLGWQLLEGPLYGDGLSLLGFIALRAGEPEAAKVYVQAAYAAHLRANDLPGLSADLTLISQTARETGDNETALKAVEASILLATSGGKISVEPAYLAKADALRMMGDRSGAMEALDKVLDADGTACNKAWAYTKRSQLQMDKGNAALAAAETAKAEQLNQQCQSKDVTEQVLRSQAWLLWRDEPGAALERLQSIEQIARMQQADWLVRSYVAARHGELDAAERHLSSAIALQPPDEEWDWDVAWARAELFELRGSPVGDAFAALFYRMATSTVGVLRSSSQVRSAHMVASYRASHDGLISLWSRHGRWREALSVVFELDASDMLRATANQSLLPASDPVGLNIFKKLAPVTLSVPAVDAVLNAWRGRDLVVVVAQGPRRIGSGNERTYRLRIRDGEVTGEDVGSAAQAREWADALFQDPDDPLAARALGEMIVPESNRRRDGKQLDVLLIGALSKVPLGALRDADGSLIVARRPLVRVLSLRADGQETEGGGSSVVLADPRGDLPLAKEEGTLVIEALRKEATQRPIKFSGSSSHQPATSERLWEADGAGLLHVAAHVSFSKRALMLAGNEEVKSETIVSRRLAPRMAVLASCGSSASTDEEGWGSIAAALLDAGTSIVVATDRRVSDEDSLRMMRGFYAQPDWRRDPARALARVQVAESKRPVSREPSIKAPWAAFSVLGRPPVVDKRVGMASSARRFSTTQGDSP